MDEDRRYTPIIDGHIHLFDGSNGTYSEAEFSRDAKTVDAVHGAIYVECLSGYEEGDDSALAPVGETRFARAAIDALSRRRGPRIVAIVGFADLSLGYRVEPVLQAHLEAGGQLFRGVRYSTTWDSDPTIPKSHVGAHPDTLESPEVDSALDYMVTYNLAWDAWVYQDHLPKVQSLARRKPNLTVVLNHLGGPLGVGRYRDSHTAASRWMRNIAELAQLPNVYIKLGGLGLPALGFVPVRPVAPVDTATILAAWHDRVRYCIDQFGPSRSMFESNFPVDARGFSYADLWDAFAHIAAHYTTAERRELFSGAALSAYSLSPDALGETA
jgi:L-fuconolactonase